MGKPIISQKRGKGSPTYTAPSFRFKGSNRMLPEGDAMILDFLHCQAHSAPLAVVESFETGDRSLVVAAEGLKVGDVVNFGGAEDADAKTGHALKLADIPEGSMIYNIERLPGDGGKFVRSSGAGAKLLTKSPEGVVVIMPSKKKKIFKSSCRAMVGTVAGSGRVDKPFLKAGKKFHAMKAKNKLFPKTSAGAMNAVDHPFGGGRGKRIKSKIAKRNAPPGRKVGHLRPKRTGYKN